MIYIVMIGVPSSYSYSGTDWSVDRVFSNEESAKNYISERQKINGSEVEYEIETHKVHEQSQTNS